MPSQGARKRGGDVVVYQAPMAIKTAMVIRDTQAIDAV